jgi:hypothetical protein
MKKDIQATYYSGFEKSIIGTILILMVTAIPCFGGETIKDIGYYDKWPQVSRGNLASDQAGATFYYAIGNALVVLDANGLNERSRISLYTKKGITGIVHDSNNDIIHLACGKGGFKTVDVSNPDTPVLMGELTKDHKSNNIFGSAVDYRDNRVYLADIDFGLRIIDVSNPANPNQSGYYEEFSIYDDSEEPASGGHINVKVRVINGVKYAFVLDQYYGLRLFDVSVDSTPRLIETYDMRTTLSWGTVSLVKDLAVDDSFVYITDSTYGLTILSLFSDPDMPGTINLKKTGQIETPGLASGIWLENDTTHVADGVKGVFVVDVSDRTAPVHVATYETSGAYAVHMTAGILFVADTTDGLAKVAKTGTFAYSKIDEYNPPCSADAVFVKGNYAYMLDNNGPKEGMNIISLDPKEGYNLTGHIETPGDANAIHVLDSHAYIADGAAGISIYDISDNAAPKMSGSETFPGNSYISDIKIYKATSVYFTDIHNGLFTANLDSPGEIAVQGNLPVDNALAVGIFIPDSEAADRYALVVNGTGLSIINVTDPFAPFLVSETVTPGQALDVGVKDRFAVVADGDGGIVLIDIRDLQNPTLTVTYETKGKAEALQIDQAYIHTATGSHGIQILGIVDSEPVEITEITSYGTPGDAAAVFVAGLGDEKFTFIGDSRGGLLSFLHSDTLFSWIDEKPFTESPHDEGWSPSNCFISTLF